MAPASQLAPLRRREQPLRYLHRLPAQTRTRIIVGPQRDQESAKFYSPEAEMEALQNAKRELQKVIKNENPPKLKRGEPHRIMVEVESGDARGFGTGFKARRDAEGLRIPHADGGYQAEPVKKIKKATFIFEYVPSKDSWAPVSYYPKC